MIPGWRGRRRHLAAGAWLLWSLLLTAGPVRAVDPTSSPAGGDVRSSSTAPGLVGDPIFAVVAVVIIGLVALGATLLYVRLTSQR